MLGRFKTLLEPAIVSRLVQPPTDRAHGKDAGYNTHHICPHCNILYGCYPGIPFITQVIGSRCDRHGSVTAQVGGSRQDHRLPGTVQWGQKHLARLLGRACLPSHTNIAHQTNSVTSRRRCHYPVLRRPKSLQNEHHERVRPLLTMPCIPQGHLYHRAY